MSDEQPVFGITLYSLSLEYRTYKYTFEELIEKTKEHGVGPGLELVGFQSIRGFPQVSDEFARRFRRLVEAFELRPSCLDANVDIGRRPDRNMTDDEVVEYLSAQVDAAVKLGFPAVRIQFGARPAALRKIAPVAERAGVRLGMEIHAPHRADGGTMLEVRRTYDEIGSPALGFIPDFGASVDAIPPGLIAREAAEGLDRKIIELVTTTWEQAHRSEIDVFAARRNLLAEVQRLGGGGPALSFAWRAMTLFGHQPPEAWAEIMPYIIHIHGKFFDIDVNGEEPSVPYARLMQVLHDGGYNGTISSEWEGSPWAAEPDGFAMVKAHQEMMGRHLAAARAQA